ncbi:MAG TPA: hypothetical protein VGG65_04135 [Thermoanaerobaculia bacterium]
MKKLATLALLLGMLSGRAFAQDAADSAKKDPTPAQLQEMKRALEAQQQQIEKLKQEAAERDKALEQMQKLVQEQLTQTEEAAKKAEQAAQSAQTSAQAAQTSVVELPPQGTILPASLSSSIEPMLQATNPATGVVTPPWAVLKISDTVNFRFGSVIQPTFEALQDANSKGYSQNMYLRRARFNVLATLPEGVTVFFQTDDPRVGNAGVNGQKNINTGFLIQDAYAQWNFLGKAMAVQAGLFLIPTERQVLTSVATFLALDLPTWSQQQGTVEEANGGRDYGVGFNGALLGDHLTYRTGVFAGYRAPTSPQEAPLGPAAGSRNPLYYAGRVQYDFFDTETGYAYVGTYLGKKKVLAIAGFGQGQGSYKGYGGDVFFDWPIADGALTAEADYIHYDGHQFTYNVNGTPATLPEQDSLYTNVGWYFCDAKIQPFARYEFLNFATVANEPKEQQRFGGGFNYYVYGQNFKIVPYYERIIPKVQPATAAIKDTNRFVLEFQGSF